MDTLSHTVLGACIGEAMLGKKIGKKALLWGALANNLPDIDVSWTPFLNPVDALLAHRGITHSFLFCIIISFILGWIFFRMNKNKSVSMRDWNLFFLVALIAHPILDSCTLYGTGIFEPFSHYRAQFTSLFIVEPLYTLPLLIAFIALLILKKESVKRKSWWNFGLYLSTIYLLFSVFNKLYVEKIFSDSLRKQDHNFTKLYSSPTPLNNILWDVFAKDANGYWFGFYSHFDKTKDVEFSFIPRNDSLAGDLLQNATVQKLIFFSHGFYCFTKCNDELRFNDLRFAFSGEFSCQADNQHFVFSFALKKNPDFPYGIEVKRSSWGTSRFMGFSKLVERIKGV